MNMPRIDCLPDGRTIEASPGESVLQAALRSGIPHTHECGGKGRCSTCRVLVLKGLEHCAPRNGPEQAMAEQLHFGPAIRLACQTVVTGDVTLRRLVLDAEDVQITDQRGARAQPDVVGEEQELAILFADVRGFTAFAAELPAYDVVHSLNRIFNRLGLVIQRHGGRIDNYMGDGLMALFGHACPPTAAHDAVGAALEMLAAMDELQQYFRDNYGKVLGLGIGVHCGEVVIGSVGSADMKRMTAIGDAVNMASRIEEANKLLGTNLLISERTYDKVKKLVLAKRWDDVRLPGKVGPHTLYQAIGWRASFTRLQGLARNRKLLNTG
jgi:adenylate cyclase